MKKWLQLSLFLLLLVVGSSVYAQEQDDAIAVITATVAPEVFQSYASPDGAWTAQVTVYDCSLVGDNEMSYEVLELIDSTTQARHVVAEQLIYCQGLGAFGLSILHWSENGRYLYYTDGREGYPDGAGFWLRPMYRVQISDRSAAYLGGGLFSPTWDMIATWQQTAEQNAVVIWNVADGEQTARFASFVPAPYLLNLFWLPDSSGVIYLLGDSFMPPAARAYLIHASLLASHQTILLQTGSD